MAKTFQLRGSIEAEISRLRVFQHSGELADLPEDVQRDIPEDILVDLDAGEWVVLFDDELEYAGFNHPENLRAEGVSGTVDILNYGREVEQRLEVIQSGECDWVTLVDDEVVETGEFHPFAIDVSA